MSLFILDDDTSNDVWFPSGVGRGLEPRDMSADPPPVYDSQPSDIILIPRSEWSARIKEMEEKKARLSDVRNIANNGKPIPSLLQASTSYCWTHSVTHAEMMARAVANEPYVPLSAFAVGAIIKRGRNEGGWCGLSAKFAREHGIPSQALWPQGTRDLSLDTPELRADAAKHKIVEEYVDLAASVYDQNLTFDQVMSCLMCGLCGPLDFNHWRHSVCGLDPVEVEPGSFGIRIWNSWGDSWGDNGTGILRGSKAVPDGALILRRIGSN